MAIDDEDESGANKEGGEGAVGSPWHRVVLVAALFALTFLAPYAVASHWRTTMQTRPVLSLAQYAFVLSVSYVIARRAFVRSYLLLLVAWYVGSRIGWLIGYAFESAYVFRLYAPWALSLGLFPGAALGERQYLLAAAAGFGFNLLLVSPILFGARRARARLT